MTTAELPSTVCRYSELMKIAPTTAPVMTAITAEADTSDRIRHIAGGTSGAATRRSMSAKPPSSSAARPNDPIVWTDVQPSVRVPSMA